MSDNSDSAVQKLYNRSLTTDREYLLRCSLTQEWDQVVQYCAFLEEHAGANPYHHQAARKLCSGQLLACDQYGNSVLQAVCYYQPPVAAVRAILRAAQTLSCRAHLVHHRSLDRSTALQVACATGASVAVIEELLLVVPFPPPPPSPPMRSSTCSSSRSNRVAKTSALHPGILVTTADQQGATPLSDLVIQYTRERKGPFSNELDTIGDVVRECATSPIFQTFWSKVELLITSAWAASAVCPDDESSSSSSSSMVLPPPFYHCSLLHGAAAIASTCPPLLTDLLVHCFPNHHCRATPVNLRGDSSRHYGGWLPLHFALSAGAVVAPLLVVGSPPILKQQQEYFIDRLLHAYPESAATPFGSFQRTPMIHAVLEKLHWHSDANYEVRRIIILHPRNSRGGGGGDGATTTIGRLEQQADDDGDTAGPVQRLCELAPNSVSQRDPLTGFYPWQLAAAAAALQDEGDASSSCTKSSQLLQTSRELRQLDTIYHLLRLDPQSLLQLL